MANVTVQNTTASLTSKTLAKLEDTQTFTGQKTFNIGASAPFVCVSGAAKVDYLDADKLDGAEGTAYHDAAQLTGDIAAARLPLANLWSVLAVEQTYASTGAQADVAPSAGDIVLIRCTGAAPEISGFSGGVANRRIRLICLGTTLKVTDQGAGSTAANRIICQTTSGLIVGVNGEIELVYDGTTSRWRAAILDSGTPITFTPTWVGSGSNPAIGNGTLTGTYSQRGKTVRFEVRVLCGGTTTFGTGTYTWALPLTAAAANRGSGFGYITDGAANRFLAAVLYVDTTTFQAAVDGTINVASATVPMTWADTDQMSVGGEYELP